MMMRPIVAVLMSATTLAALPASAQSAEAPAVTADQLAKLQEQIEALQKQVDALKASAAKATPAWKGAPQWADASAGWSFKPRGRFQYDTAYVSVPGAYAANRNLGFNSRVRRLRIGAEGSIPGGFGYLVDVDFANANVGFGDVILSYTAKNRHWGVRLGNQETLNGLDQMTSDNYTSFQERPALFDGFNNVRRVGAVASLLDPADHYRVEAGLFAAHSIDGSFDNDGWIGAARAVYATPAFGGKIHLAANVQHREFQSNNNALPSVSVSAPSTNQLARYRARPFVQSTDVRFVDTGSFAAKSDTIFGVELAGIFKNAYFASEAQWVKPQGYRAGDIATGLDAFAGGSAVTPEGDPTFFGAYGEFGIFLTGEERGYKEGAWARTKVLKPIDKGGAGAFQLAVRYDYLDLTSGKLIRGRTNNFANGTSSLAAVNSRLGRGGRQTNYLIGLNWYPIDYVRLMLNYSHTEVEGGPFAASVAPLSTQQIDVRKFSTDAVAVRAQVDF